MPDADIARSDEAERRYARGHFCRVNCSRPSALVSLKRQLWRQFNTCHRKQLWRQLASVSSQLD